MLTSATTVLERRKLIDDVHATHPYEAGWASEAVFFVQAEGPHPDLDIQAQVSPDGINWVDRDRAARLGASEAMVELDLQRFGGWLRLVIRGADAGHTAKILVHLAMKG